MPRDSTKVATKVALESKRHHSREVCKRGHHETICLDNRSMSGHCYTEDKCVDLPNHQGCGWTRNYSQSVHVEQEPIKLVLKEGCRNKRPDNLDVNLKFKDGHVRYGDFTVHVDKPKVHIQPQKVIVEVEEAKDKCCKPKIHVCCDKPKIHVEAPKIHVHVDKHKCPIQAPEPIICVKYRKPCKK